VILLLMLLSFAFAEGIHFSDAERGIFFGEKEKKERKEEKKEKKEKEEEFVFPVVENAPPPVRAFLREPTEENAREFLKWQAQYFQHLNRVAMVLHQTYLKYGPEVYPVSGYPANYWLADQRDELIKELVRKAKNRVRELVVYYFASARCPACARQTPLMEELAKEWEVDVRVVSVDGSTIQSSLPYADFDGPLMSQALGIRGTPTIVLAVLKDNEPELFYLGVGFTPLSLLLQRMVDGLVQLGILRPEETNINFGGWR